MNVLQQLKSFDPQAHTVDEMVCLLATANGMAEIYETQLAGEQPEWLIERRSQLEKELDSRYRDELERQLKEVQARQEALKSQEEKRHDLKDKEARLRERLDRVKAGSRGVIA